MASSQQLCHQGPFGAFSLSQNLLTTKLIFPIRDYLCSILPRLANFPINRVPSPHTPPLGWSETNLLLAHICFVQSDVKSGVYGGGCLPSNQRPRCLC